MDTEETGLSRAVVAPLELLGRELRQWLPLVVVLAWVSALPEILMKVFAPEVMSTLGWGWLLEPDALLTGLGAVGVLLCAKFIVEFATYMFAYVILADLTAGRPRDLGRGLRRLANLKLQLVWIVSGFFEQSAIASWFLGGGLVLVPLGLATPAAYEELCGFSAFSRSLQLGLLQTGQGAAGRPGVRIAAATTVGFALGFAVTSAVSLVSCATSLVGGASGGPGIGDLLGVAMGGGLGMGGGLDKLPALSLPSYGAADIVFDLVLAPLAMLPVIYMMTVQQMTYWEARRWAEAHPDAS